MEEIKPDDSSFNLLLQTVLGDLYKDLAEAEKNVRRYDELLSDSSNEMNIAMYGPLLNDSLKIKAGVRDKIIKILGNLKDRVRTKEQQGKGNESTEDFTERQLAELVEKVLNKDS